MRDPILGYARMALETIKSNPSADPTLNGFAHSIDHYGQLTKHVIRQTERRAMSGEKVPAQEKVSA